VDLELRDDARDEAQVVRLDRGVERTRKRVHDRARRSWLQIWLQRVRATSIVRERFT
jgi:hypothetical protein